MVHQHFMLIPVMTVTENIVLANEPVHAGILLDESAAEKRVAEVARTFNFAVDPHARIQDITVGSGSALRS
jgi:simple sugar transport system ATP-binding protein